MKKEEPKKEFRASSVLGSESKKTVEIFLDDAYSRGDAEDARRRPSRFSTAKKLDEPLDRKTRLYFESAPPDLLKRFVALGFSPARGASRVVDVWQTFQAAKSSTILSLGAKACLRSVSRLLSGGDSFRRTDSNNGSGSRFRDELTKRYARTTVANTIAGLRTFGAAWSYGRTPLRRAEPVLGGRSRFDFEQSARLSSSGRLGGADFRPLPVSKLTNALRALAVRRIAPARTDVLPRRFDSMKLDAGRLIVFAPKTERYKNNGVREVPIAPILRRELVAHLKTMPQDEDFLIYENRRKAFDSRFRKIIFAAGLKNQSKTLKIISVMI